jgi:hypothetical protein
MIDPDSRQHFRIRPNRPRRYRGTLSKHIDQSSTQMAEPWSTRDATKQADILPHPASGLKE